MLLKKATFIFIFFLFFADAVLAQPNFEIGIFPSPINNFPALHSGAFASYQGNWIYIGGRIDGLHNFNTTTGFETYNRNDSVFVFNPSTQQLLSTSLDVLPIDIYESLVTANSSFCRADSMLYIVGGYGNSSNAGYITFQTLTAVNLNSLISNMTAYQSIVNDFRQIIDTNMAISGGALAKIDSTFYLVMGHKFNGRYDKNSPSIFFTQRYSNQIRKFNITDDGVNLSVNNFTSVTDAVQMHRRDYNLCPQIFPNGEVGVTAFGGVFQPNANQPYFNPIDITSSGYNVQTSFSQNLEQYTTAHAGIFDNVSNEMHNIFFGGMSMYVYDSATSTLVSDTLVPFVNTISDVVRNTIGSLSEYQLSTSMPALIGTNAEFIIDAATPVLNEGIIDLTSLPISSRIGYVVGGIESDAPNISNIDPVGMSRPSATIYEVWLTKTTGVNHIKIESEISELKITPNPAARNCEVSFSLLKPIDKIEMKLVDASGKIFYQRTFKNLNAGLQNFSVDLNKFSSGIYFCNVNALSLTRTVVLEVVK